MTIREEILNAVECPMIYESGVYALLKGGESEAVADRIEAIFNRRLKEIAEKAWEAGYKTRNEEAAREQFLSSNDY